MRIRIRYRTKDGLFHDSAARENLHYSLSVKRTEGRIRVTIVPKETILLKSAVITLPYDFPPDGRIFVNGYQSWTETREYELDEELTSLNRLPNALLERYHFASYGDSWFRRYRKGELHGFTFAYVRDAEGNADLFGSLNEENAWLIIRYEKSRGKVRLESDCENRKINKEFPLFDFVRYKGKIYHVIHSYFDLFGKCGAPKLRGYTSWYLDYQNINEQKMRAALDSIDPDHFDLFQIDDGYETYVGDWMDIDPEKFPEGLERIVSDIHAKGLKAGIWLAPFVCETKSRLFKEHPDWVCRYKNGEPVYAGSNWSGFCPLDLRKKAVRSYIKNCLDYFIELGFDFFKLDFLYAAAMVPGSKFTRAEFMRNAMAALRKELEGKLILGCGVPLSSAFNLVDYCRVGPDVSLSFDDVPYMRLLHRERVSTKNTLQNTIFRHCMDGTVFRCDPDVFLLRDESNSLTDGQKEALLMINHLCGSVYMTSDNVGNYDLEKEALLLKAQKLSGAKVCDVTKAGPFVVIVYELDDEHRILLYNTKTGYLL